MARLSAWDNAVNNWEHPTVHWRDPRPVSVAEAQGILAHVYQLAGIPERPAHVTMVPDRDSPDYTPDTLAYVNGEGTQMVLVRPERCSTSVVLHEAAHLLTEDPLDRLECRQPVEPLIHGPIWLSNYLWLLHKLMGPSFNTFYLRGTMPAALNPAAINFYPTIRGKPRSDLA